MTSRPRRTPFITKKEPSGTGAAKSPDKLQLPGEQAAREGGEVPTPSNNMVFNIGKRRQEGLSLAEPTKKGSFAGGNGETKKEEGMDRIMLRPNLGIKKKKQQSPPVRAEEKVLQNQEYPPVITVTEAIDPPPSKESLEPIREAKQIKEVKEVTKKPFELKAPFMIKKGNAKEATSREKIISVAEDSTEKVPDRPTFGGEAEQQIRQSMRPVLRPPKKMRSPMANEPNDQKFQASIGNGELDSMTMPSPIPAANYRINLAELEIREVNVEQETKHVSQGKLEKQKERVKQLKKLLNLQLDSYEQTLNLGSITDYELYISKIKSGFVNNSLDQAFDDTAEAQCQSLPLEFADFGQQFPQDKNKSYLGGEQQQSNSVSLYRFISRVATVVQELLRPSKTFEMPPIFLLSLKPEFIKVSYCPYPVSLYKAGDLSVATVGQKLYVCRGQVTCLRSIGKFMLAGTKQGSVLLWGGNSDRGSLYDSVYALLNNCDFELPTFSSDSIEKQSYFKSISPIVRILERSSDQFESLEQFGKIVTWRIVTEQNNFGELIYKLKPLTYTSLTTLFCDANLLCFDMESDGSLYVCSSKGILKTKGGEHNSLQIYLTDSRCNKVYLSKKGNLMYCLCQDNSVQIFDRSVSACLLRFEVPTKGTIKDILIPKIETDTRELQIYNEFFITDSKGIAYRYNLVENKTEPRQVITKSNSDDRNLIYSRVTLQENRLDFLFVTRQLMTTVVSEQTGINLEKSAQNYKRIIEDNKTFRGLLQDAISL